MISDGGYVFPSLNTMAANRGITLRDYFAIRAPEPTKEEIETHYMHDKLANPHNDAHKPKRRARLEIIADVRYAYADAMIAASKRSV